MAPKKQIFGNKEDAQFRDALNLYQQKQYKKALKLVDLNLKKNSLHAESLALKGCIYYHNGNRADSEGYIKKALGKEPENYHVDHLAGAYYRTIDNFPEAAKWLKAAVDNGSPDRRLLVDLGAAQTHTRDYKNLTKTRRKYLELEPGYRANWSSSAIAFHLNKDYKAAISTLTKIEGIIKTSLQELDMYEQSECILYKIDILFESGDVQKALDQLEEDKDWIKDILSYHEYKAKFLMILGRSEEASYIYRRLLQRNPGNVEYYKLLELCLKTVEAPLETRLKLYDNLSKFYPKADPPKFLPLTFIPSTNPEFKARVSQYILQQLKKGVPATFVNIKPLLKNKKKLAVIKQVVEDFYGVTDNEAPIVKLWTLYFLAQLYLYEKDLDKAQEFITLALDHSPTLVELYILKARIQKHYGKYAEAAETMNDGRLLDLQDRFINSKATKYYLRANNVDKAVDLISMFTKLDEEAINGCKDLHTMQANWFLTESAEAYLRLYHQYEQELKEVGDNEELANELAEKAETYKGLAIKRFRAVVKIFGIFYQDQYDFYFYCPRKGTVRDLIKTLQWEDELHATPIFVRVVKGLTSILFELYEQQQQKKNNPEEEEIKIKKNNKKQKKVKTKLSKQKESLIARVQSEKDDSDPLGTAYLHELENGDILEEVNAVGQKLFKEASGYQFTWELSFKLNLLQSKYVLCLQAIKSLNSILKGNDKYNKVETMIKELCGAVSKDEAVNVAIKTVVQKGLCASFPQFEQDINSYF